MKTRCLYYLLSSCSDMFLVRLRLWDWFVQNDGNNRKNWPRHANTICVGRSQFCHGFKFFSWFYIRSTAISVLIIACLSKFLGFHFWFDRNVSIYRMDGVVISLGFFLFVFCNCLRRYYGFDWDFWSENGVFFFYFAVGKKRDTNRSEKEKRSFLKWNACRTRKHEKEGARQSA